MVTTKNHHKRTPSTGSSSSAGVTTSSSQSSSDGSNQKTSSSTTSQAASAASCPPVINIDNNNHHQIILHQKSTSSRPSSVNCVSTLNNTLKNYHHNNNNHNNHHVKTNHSNHHLIQTTNKINGLTSTSKIIQKKILNGKIQSFQKGSEIAFVKISGTTNGHNNNHIHPVTINNNHVTLTSGSKSSLLLNPTNGMVKKTTSIGSSSSTLAPTKLPSGGGLSLTKTTSNGSTSLLKNHHVSNITSTSGGTSFNGSITSSNQVSNSLSTATAASPSSSSSSSLLSSPSPSSITSSLSPSTRMMCVQRPSSSLSSVTLNTSSSSSSKSKKNDHCSSPSNNNNTITISITSSSSSGSSCVSSSVNHSSTSHTNSSNKTNNSNGTILNGNHRVVCLNPSAFLKRTGESTGGRRECLNSNSGTLHKIQIQHNQIKSHRSVKISSSSDAHVSDSTSISTKSVSSPSSSSTVSLLPSSPVLTLTSGNLKNYSKGLSKSFNSSNGSIFSLTSPSVGTPSSTTASLSTTTSVQNNNSNPDAHLQTPLASVVSMVSKAENGIVDDGLKINKKKKKKNKIDLSSLSMVHTSVDADSQISISKNQKKLLTALLSESSPSTEKILSIISKTASASSSSSSVPKSTSELHKSSKNNNCSSKSKVIRISDTNIGSVDPPVMMSNVPVGKSDSSSNSNHQILTHHQKPLQSLPSVSSSSSLSVQNSSSSIKKSVNCVNSSKNNHPPDVQKEKRDGKIIFAAPIKKLKNNRSKEPKINNQLSDDIFNHRMLVDLDIPTDDNNVLIDYYHQSIITGDDGKVDQISTNDNRTQNNFSLPLPSIMREGLILGSKSNSCSQTSLSSVDQDLGELRNKLISHKWFLTKWIKLKSCEVKESASEIMKSVRHEKKRRKSDLDLMIEEKNKRISGSDSLFKTSGGSIRKGICCFTSEDDDGDMMISSRSSCSLPALPFTRHCKNHILYNVDQVLFERCTAKLSSLLTQCSNSTFDIEREEPLCSDHLKNTCDNNTLDDSSGAAAINSGNNSSQTSNGSNKSSNRRRNKNSMALIRPARRKKKKQGAGGKGCSKGSSGDNHQETLASATLLDDETIIEQKDADDLEVPDDSMITNGIRMETDVAHVDDVMFDSSHQLHHNGFHLNDHLTRGGIFDTQALVSGVTHLQSSTQRLNGSSSHSMIPASLDVGIPNIADVGDDALVESLVQGLSPLGTVGTDVITDHHNPHNLNSHHNDFDPMGQVILNDAFTISDHKMIPDDAFNRMGVNSNLMNNELFIHDNHLKSGISDPMIIDTNHLHLNHQSTDHLHLTSPFNSPVIVNSVKECHTIPNGDSTYHHVSPASVIPVHPPLTPHFTPNGHPQMQPLPPLINGHNGISSATNGILRPMNHQHLMHHPQLTIPNHHMTGMMNGLPPVAPNNNTPHNISGDELINNILGSLTTEEQQQLNGLIDGALASGAGCINGSSAASGTPSSAPAILMASSPPLPHLKSAQATGSSSSPCSYFNANYY